VRSVRPTRSASLGAWDVDGVDQAGVGAAILAFLSLSVRREHVFCQGTSNGLAAATEFDQAVLQATFEIVERDALLFAWLTGRPGVRIELDDACDQRLRSVIDAVGALGATVEAYLLPDGVYGATVLCLALGDGHRYPGVTFGLATDVDAHGALHERCSNSDRRGRI